jgi:hypothetical protein
VDSVPVVDPVGGYALGLLSRSHVAAYLRAEAELASTSAKGQGRSPTPNEV